METETSTPLVKSRRDTTSPYTLDETPRAILRLAKRTAKNLETKMKRFPHGQVVVIIKAQGGTQTSGVRPLWHVVGDGALKHAVEAHVPELQRHIDDTNYLDPKEFLEVPGNAERRARKLRGLMKLAWARHVADTAHKGSKQMYAVVKRHPELKFSWWDPVTGGAPFENTTIDNPEISSNVFAFLGPRLYAVLKEEEELM